MQKLFISFLFIFTFFSIQNTIQAQDTFPTDTVAVQADTVEIVTVKSDLTLPDSIPETTSVKQEAVVPQKFFSGIEIGIDYLKFVSLLLPFEEKYEASIGFIFRNKLAFTLEVGESTLTPVKSYQYKNADYLSTGRYGRIGFNYILVSDKQSSLMAGARFGQTSFNEKIGFTVEIPFEEFTNQGAIERGLTAHWYEVILATESALFKNLYAGAILRFRILGKVTEKEELPFKVHSIPGYGRAFDKTIPALNLYLKYKLNF